MEFSEYQKAALKTAVYPDKGNNIVYPVLGLAGESGEVAEKVKKIIRNNDGIIDTDRKELLKKELGDVLWYIAAICYETGLDMDEVAQNNIRKLRDRQKRDLIHGNGDNR